MIKIVDLVQYVGEEVEIGGWVSTVRIMKKVSFVQVNDGSTMKDAQVVTSAEVPVPDNCYVGGSIRVRGIVVQSPGPNQPLEVKATSIEVVGDTSQHDPATYALAKKEHPLEHLRAIPHLRVRTKLMRAIFGVRNVCSKATHDFFQYRGFKWVHTPLMTGSDCEGAGEVFELVTSGDVGLKSSDDDAQRFFKRRAYLTVSGQLNGEACAHGMGDIYTFGPTFRAEKSLTNRHLAEFWMIEPEMVFCTHQDLMQVAERYIVHCIKTVLSECKDELEFLAGYIKEDLVGRLTSYVESQPIRLPYGDAVTILRDEYKFDVKWGDDLGSDMEKKLCEKFKTIVTVHNYPASLKAFYMIDSATGDGTVENMDVLVPGVGELVGGSMREWRLQRLITKMESKGLNVDEYEWYLDLRRFGSVPHGGFGLGFERLVQLCTGMKNIRDVTLFPRAYTEMMC